MNRLAVLYAVISLAVLVVPNVVAPAAASPYTGGTDGWTIVGQPSMTQLSPPTAKANYQNNLNVTIAPGLVYLVLHNSLGQTVFINAGTISSVAAGKNSTAFLVIYNVPGGTYSGTIFATLASGTAMSVPTTASVTF